MKYAASAKPCHTTISYSGIYKNAAPHNTTLVTRLYVGKQLCLFSYRKKIRSIPMI